MIVQCFEPQGQPRSIALELGPTGRFCIYAINDLLGDETQGLRVTVLRQPDKAPPPNSQFVVELEVRRRRPGDAPNFRVVRVGRGTQLEWLRHDGRSRVTRSTELKDGSRFEVTLPDMRSIIFALETKTEVEQGAMAGVGGKGRRSSALASEGLSSAYIVPAAAALMSDPWARLKGGIVGAGRKLGLSPAMLVPMMLLLTMMVGALVVGGFAWYQKGVAEEELAKAQQAKQQAEAGRDAALQAESACIEERQSIAQKLDEISQARKLHAEMALAAPMAQAIAVELGGARMGAEEALEYDQVAMKNTRAMVVAEMGKKRPDMGSAERCLGQLGVLGQDLPEYVLMWHPKKEYQCPEEFVLADGPVHRAGPWGISQRAADEFGAPVSSMEMGADPGEEPPDPRLNHRWSAHAMAVGLREIGATLLEAETGERPPVSPGQAHLWSLAVWDAYNQLPSPAEGVMDKSAEDCVEDLIGQAVAASGPAEPGQPVLSDLSVVALGEGITLTPTAGCPWPTDALEQGAQRAVEAVTRLAVLRMKQEEEGEESG